HRRAHAGPGQLQQRAFPGGVAGRRRRGLEDRPLPDLLNRAGAHARIADFSPARIGEPVSIKSDKWIRRMAENEGMIDPFEPGQVKRGGAGDRLISYGTSSYGYDVRCADEFKVFTNINSTIV